MEYEKGESNTDRLAELKERFQSYQDYWLPIYERGADDTDFALGIGQWPEKVANARKKMGRLCLVENRILPFVNQVINTIRQARPSIIPKPVDDKADVEVAEILRGVIKNIEVTSDADTVYDTAARNTVMGSVGWIRIITQYAGHDTFDQEIRLERIQNMSSVYIDPNHERQDGSDARDVFVFEDMDCEEFEDKYPDAAKTGYSDSKWGGDTIKVCEHFTKDYEDKELCEFQIDTVAGLIKGVVFKDKVPDGATIVRTRKTQVCTIKYCKFTEQDILEEGEFPGTYLPLVPVYGFEAIVDGTRTFYSLIHQARDPQMMLNFWRSASTEVFALQPKAPFVGALGQFNTYAQQWNDANTENFATLEYDPVTVVGENGETVVLPPPMRQPPPTPSLAIMQEAVGAAEAIKATLGMYDASIGNQTNDISGKAIISRQMQGDNATFHFTDNLAVSMRQVGRILVNLIPIIYTGQRIMRIMGEDGKESLVPINQPVVKEGAKYRIAHGDEVSNIISFDAGKYDVVVEVGRSYATKRQEMSNLLMDAMNGNPDMFAKAGDLLFQNLDVPGADEVAKRLRATMDPALLGDDVEAKRLQLLNDTIQQLQQKLDLTEQALLAKKNNEEFQNMLDAKKVENDTTKLKIEAAKAEAEIAKIKSETQGMDMEDIGILSSAIAHLKANTDDVTQALHILLSAKENEGETGEPLNTPETKEPSYVGQPDIGSDATNAA